MSGDAVRRAWCASTGMGVIGTLELEVKDGLFSPTLKTSLRDTLWPAFGSCHGVAGCVVGSV